MHPVVHHGSDELKARVLPAVADGSLHVAFGVTEPDAGTDTTRITTRAERRGDHYVVNGRKVWTSKALEADRILLLDGLPNYQRIGSLRIGQTLREQFESDLAIEHEVVARLKPGIAMCRDMHDSTTAILFEEILADEEQHIDYLETQLQLMDRLGEELYCAQCVSRPPS